MMLMTFTVLLEFFFLVFPVPSAIWPWDQWWGGKRFFCFHFWFSVFYQWSFQPQSAFHEQFVTLKIRLVKCMFMIQEEFLDTWAIEQTKCWLLQPSLSPAFLKFPCAPSVNVTSSEKKAKPLCICVPCWSLFPLQMSSFKGHFADIRKDSCGADWPGSVYQCKVMVKRQGVHAMCCQ